MPYLYHCRITRSCFDTLVLTLFASSLGWDQVKKELAINYRVASWKSPYIRRDIMLTFMYSIIISDLFSPAPFMARTAFGLFSCVHYCKVVVDMCDHEHTGSKFKSEFKQQWPASRWKQRRTILVGWKPDPLDQDTCVAIARSWMQAWGVTATWGPNLFATMHKNN